MCEFLTLPLFSALLANPATTGDAATYTRAASCAKCHADSYKKWSGARHSKMVQPATASSVRGNFARGQITLRGEKYTVASRGGAYYITESYLTGQPREHRIDYTLGNRRIGAPDACR